MNRSGALNDEIAMRLKSMKELNCYILYHFLTVKPVVFFSSNSFHRNDKVAIVFQSSNSSRNDCKSKSSS